MNVIINKMSVENANEINQLSTQLGYYISLQETQNQIKKVIELKDHVALVALSENIVIGWIHAFIAIRIESKPFIEIGGLVVDENFRNRSIGKRLVDSVAEWCMKENISALRVRCNRKRKEAHLFYKKLKFLETKEQKIFQLDL